MKPGKKTLTIAGLSAVVVLASLFAARDEIYFALNHDQMIQSLNNKHLSRLLESPSNGVDQESLITQIKLLKASRWSRFLSTEKAKLLDDKVAQLNEGIERRKLLTQIKIEENEAASKSAALKQRELADNGKLTATVTRYLLDAPPNVTEGEATFNEKEGYVDFFNENDSGHRYNHRCYRSGSVSESDSIITKESWENEPDYICSMQLGQNGLPVSVIIKSQMNNGFVALRGTFTTKQNHTQPAAKPEYCPKTMKEKQFIVEQLTAERITAAEGRSKFENIRSKVAKCYESV